MDPVRKRRFASRRQAGRAQRIWRPPGSGGVDHGACKDVRVVATNQECTVAASFRVRLVDGQPGDPRDTLIETDERPELRKLRKRLEIAAMQFAARRQIIGRRRRPPLGLEEPCRDLVDVEPPR